ncbi:SDR family NAD(P)-dependent oxidoreductase [Nonomuraea dietziae]|uniref:SDR family NAD(P)-dependent oxidoreductase n=1 Tax=Nonomuraea dietziae TaxID=65515 RepID=UPI0031DFA87E
MHHGQLTVAITGANSGIGLRAARRLAAQGHRLLIICRDPGRGEAAAATIENSRLIVADLADPTSIDEAAATITRQVGHLDVLINNAAVFDQAMREPAITRPVMSCSGRPNHLGPFQLTARLSHLLAAAPRPRVINVASKGLVTMPRIKIRFDQLDETDWYSPTRAYYHAKLAQIMFTYSLAMRTGDSLDVACVRVPSVRLDAERVAAMPWLLRTLYAPKNRAALPPDRLGESYALLTTRIESWRDRPASGGPLHGIYLDEDLHPVRAPAQAYDAAARDRLWSVSQLATGHPQWAW